MSKKTIIIAEAGVNHNGSLKMAKRLVNAAKDAGVDFRCNNKYVIIKVNL